MVILTKVNQAKRSGQKLRESPRKICAPTEGKRTKDGRFAKHIKLFFLEKNVNVELGYKSTN